MLRNYPITRAYVTVVALLAVAGGLWLLVGSVSDGSPMTTLFLALGILTMPLSQVLGGAAFLPSLVPVVAGVVGNTGVLLLLDHLVRRYRTRQARS